LLSFLLENSTIVHKYMTVHFKRNKIFSNIFINFQRIFNKTLWAKPLLKKSKKFYWRVCRLLFEAPIAVAMCFLVAKRNMMVSLIKRMLHFVSITIRSNYCCSQLFITNSLISQKHFQIWCKFSFYNLNTNMGTRWCLTFCSAITTSSSILYLTATLLLNVLIDAKFCLQIIWIFQIIQKWNFKDVSIV